MCLFPRSALVVLSLASAFATNACSPGDEEASASAGPRTADAPASGVANADGGAGATEGGIASPPPDGGPSIGDGGGPVRTPTSFTLTSTTSGDLPFTVGLGFGRGDVPTSFALDLPDAQVEIKRRWNDGSVKHAVVSGFATLTAGAPRTVKIVTGSYVGGTALTCADIAKAKPTATVTLAGVGSVSLDALLAAPVRTWLTGPEAVECHYAAPVGAHPSLRVWFHVRLHRDGRTLVRTIVENGYLDGTNTDASYVPTVTVNGAPVFGNGGASLTHYAHTRWVADGWIGGDPKITPRHDTTYLTAARLLPNYWTKKPAASAALDGATQVYKPMGQGDFTTSMGETGYQPQIGLLPNWDGLYVTSGADPRAFRAVVANALSLGSYPIVWRDRTDDLPTRPTARPKWTVEGDGQGGVNDIAAGPLTWESAHHPSGGYLAYLLTGDYVHLETMQHQAATVYLVGSSAWGAGTSRILQGQTRGSAWGQRTIGQLAAIGPDDAVTKDYRALLANNAAHWRSVANTLGPNALGFVYEYNTNAYAPGAISPWMQNFFVQTYGLLSDLEPLDDMTALNAVRDFLYRVPVGLLGAGTSDYCFTRASTYTINIASGTISDISQAFTSWHDVDVATNGGASACGTTLLGDSGGAPTAAASGYWGNLMPAIAYAVDHGAPGAAAAWKRLTGAANWNVVEAAEWDTTAPWAIVPRGF